MAENRVRIYLVSSILRPRFHGLLENGDMDVNLELFEVVHEVFVDKHCQRIGLPTGVSQ